MRERERGRDRNLQTTSKDRVETPWNKHKYMRGRSRDREKREK